MLNITTLLFDLDGTLVDTAPDMANALNLILKKYRRAPVSYDEVRTTISKGSQALIKLGFGDQESENRLNALQQEYLEIYSQHLYHGSHIFAGVEHVLQTLEQNGIGWGVVTNKPGWLAEPLMEMLGLFDKAACVVSGDTLKKRKPHPDQLLHACQLLNQRTDQCVYIGDDERDIQAADAANMTSIIALYGYIHKNETPENWGTPHTINAPREIIDWLQQHTDISLKP